VKRGLERGEEKGIRKDKNDEKWMKGEQKG
jgi:hypothetical protein